MRVLGVPSRVVTVFNAAHDTDGNLSVEEYYSSSGEKLNLTKDSVWWVDLCLKSDFFQWYRFVLLFVLFCFFINFFLFLLRLFYGAHMEHSISVSQDR